MKTFYCCLVCFAFFLTSCSDNGKKEGNPELPAGVTADVSYKAEAGSDFSELFRMSVRYTNAEGKTVTEAITQMPWTKTVSNVSVPFTAAMEWVLEPSENYPDKETYEVGFGYGISYSTTDGQGYDGMTTSKMNISRDKVAAYRESFTKRELRLSEEIKAKQ